MKIKQVLLKIEGMNCTSCAMTIDMDLEDLKGISKASTSYAKQVCEIEFDEEIVNEEDLKRTIHKSGYKALTFEK